MTPLSSRAMRIPTFSEQLKRTISKRSKFSAFDLINHLKLHPNTLKIKNKKELTILMSAVAELSVNELKVEDVKCTLTLLNLKTVQLSSHAIRIDDCTLAKSFVDVALEFSPMFDSTVEKMNHINVEQIEHLLLTTICFDDNAKKRSTALLFLRFMPNISIVELVVNLSLNGDRIQLIDTKNNCSLRKALNNLIDTRCYSICNFFCSCFNIDHTVDCVLHMCVKHKLVPSNEVIDSVLGRLYKSPDSITNSMINYLKVHDLRLWTPDWRLEIALAQYCLKNGIHNEIFKPHCTKSIWNAIGNTHMKQNRKHIMNKVYEEYIERIRNINEIGTLRKFHATSILEKNCLEDKMDEILKEAPECPLTHAPIVRPAKDKHGRVYELDFIRAWVARDGRNPFTREQMVIIEQSTV